MRGNSDSTLHLNYSYVMTYCENCTYTEKNLNTYNVIILRKELTLDNKDTKLTIRIADEDLREIDEFLASNQRFGSRSEFIRHSVLDYISRTRVGIIEQSEPGLKLSKNMDTIITAAVQKGFFKTKEEVIEMLLERAMKSNALHEILSEKLQSYSSVVEDLEKFDSLQDKMGITAAKKRI